MRTTILVSADPKAAFRIGRMWTGAGDSVTVVLLDAASAVVRPGHASGAELAETLDAGVTVAVQQDALRRRGLGAGRVAEGVKTLDLDEIADLVMEGGDGALWL